MSLNLRASVSVMVLAGWLAVMTGCAGGPPKMTEAQQAAAVPSGQMENGVRVVKIEAKKFEFIPDQVVVRAGDQVRLEVTSTDVTHGLAIPDYKIDRKLEPGKTEIITFTADRTGSFPFACSVFCGLGHGEMKGRLEVLPAK